MITTLPAENVFELGFSPLGTFVITWQRPTKDENGDAVKNLKVWRVVEEGEKAEDGQRSVIGQFVQKAQTGWNLQYTYDERYCVRSVTNEVQFYESGNLSTVWNKLRAEGVADFALSPGKSNTIAVFIPERKVGSNPVSILLLLGFVLTPSRAFLPQSRCSPSRNSVPPCRKRHSSRATKFN